MQGFYKNQKEVMYVKKKKQAVSQNIFFAGVVALLVVTVFGTLAVMDRIGDMSSFTRFANEGSGTVSVIVSAPPAVPVEGSGYVSFSIVDRGDL